MKEVDMYLPLKTFLEKKGYDVYAEVEGIDVVAQKEDDVMMIEMKTKFNLQLVYQLMERLKMTSHVYAYLPLEKGGRWPKPFKRMSALLKRLHCGLITLDQHERKTVVVEFDPRPFTGRTNYVKKKLALKEVKNRSIDLNQAGSSKAILFTAYKEKAIRVAMYLFEHGASSTKNIKEELDMQEAPLILSKNYQKWFSRVSRGVYQLTPEFEFFRIKYRKQIQHLWR